MSKFYNIDYSKDINQMEPVDRIYHQASVILEQLYNFYNVDDGIVCKKNGLEIVSRHPYNLIYKEKPAIYIYDKNKRLFCWPDPDIDSYDADIKKPLVNLNKELKKETAKEWQHRLDELYELALETSLKENVNPEEYIKKSEELVKLGTLISDKRIIMDKHTYYDSYFRAERVHYDNYEKSERIYKVGNFEITIVKDKPYSLEKNKRFDFTNVVIENDDEILYNSGEYTFFGVKYQRYIRGAWEEEFNKLYNSLNNVEIKNVIPYYDVPNEYDYVFDGALKQEMIQKTQNNINYIITQFGCDYIKRCIEQRNDYKSINYELIKKIDGLTLTLYVESKFKYELRDSEILSEIQQPKHNCLKVIGVSVRDKNGFEVLNNCYDSLFWNGTWIDKIRNIAGKMEGINYIQKTEKEKQKNCNIKDIEYILERVPNDDVLNKKISEMYPCDRNIKAVIIENLLLYTYTSPVFAEGYYMGDDISLKHYVISKLYTGEIIFFRDGNNRCIVNKKDEWEKQIRDYVNGLKNEEPVKTIGQKKND